MIPLERQSATIAELEQRIDDFVQQLPYPIHGRTAATWALLTLAEDNCRMLFALRESLNTQHAIAVLDKAKYGLKRGLWELYRRFPNDAFQPAAMQEPNEREYTSVLAFLNACTEYETMVVPAFLSFHARRATASFDPKTGVLDFSSLQRTLQYVALDAAIGQAEDPGALAVLWHWLPKGREWPPIVRDLQATARAHGNRIDYDFDPALAARLDEEVPVPKALLPASWSCDLGPAALVQRITRAIQIRCLYHVIVVFTGAADIPGYAIASALLVAPFEKLITEIALISGLTPDHVMPALEILTYGRDTTHPDPALQPFMPLGDQVALPCMLTVSNDMERNFLTLLARVRPKDFHRGSHAFELQMISEILGAVHEKGWHVRERVLIPGRPDLGDLDILLCDPTQALLLELRWTIPPAEPKEIFHRSNELQGKQAQLLRKLDGLTPATLEHLSGVPQKAGIALAGAVVLEGWAGSVVPDEVKVINLQLLLRGIQHTASLADLATWITTGDWLPEAGRHFREQRAHATMGDLKVGWVGMSLTAVGRWFVELATLSGHDRRLQEKLLTEYTIFFERLQKQRPDLMFLCEACLHHGQLIEQVGIALRLHMPATRTDGAYHEATLTVRLPLDEPPFALVEVGTARSVKDFRKRLRQAGVTHTEYLAKIGDLMGQQQLRESLTALEIAPQSRAQPLIGHILYSIVDGALLVAFGWRHEVNGFLNVPHNLS